MFNIVTKEKGFPATVLIRGLDCKVCDGPGKLTEKFNVTKEKHDQLDLTDNTIWLEDRGRKLIVESGKRIGVDYAGKWADKPWRFYSK